MKKVTRQTFLFLLLLGCLFNFNLQAAYNSTVQRIKKSNHLSCGVAAGIAGFSFQDNKGEWHGFNVQLCRVLAAAVLGDKNKVSFIPVSTQNRFKLLQTNKIDVLINNTTWTAKRDITSQVKPVVVSFYDEQTFLINKSLGITSSLQLSGKTICMRSQTTTIGNVEDFFKLHHMKYTPLLFTDIKKLQQAFIMGKCNVIAGDLSVLQAIKIVLKKKQQDIFISPDSISKEPLALFVERNDPQWENVVRWSFYSLIQAEKERITSKNIDKLNVTATSLQKNFLMKTQQIGKWLQLDEKWVFSILKQVGNYGEIFDSTVGKNSILKRHRSLNRLAYQGGLMYAMPF